MEIFCKVEGCFSINTYPLKGMISRICRQLDFMVLQLCLLFIVVSNELMRTSHLCNVNFYTYLALQTNLKVVSAFLDWCFCDSRLCGRDSKMAWRCLHLKFMGAIHFKHINRIKWPHSAAAFNKGYSSTLFSICTDENGLFLTSDVGETLWQTVIEHLEKAPRS